MKNKLKIGILGCGAVAHRWYLKGLCNENDEYELDVVCDIDEEKAKNAAKKFNIPFYCCSIEEMLDRNLDLAVILTNHDNHYNSIKLFLEKGINVYSEKPLTSTVREGKTLIEIAKNNHLVLGSAPQVMLSSRNIAVKKMIEADKIGKITLVRASCSNLGPAGRADTDYDPAWFYKDGGSLVSLGIYGLSTLIWFLGVPKFVAALEGIVMPQREVLFGPAKGKKFSVTAPDNVVAIFDYGEGKFVLFDGSYSVATPPKYDFEIHGTKGSLLVGGFGGSESILFKPINSEPIFEGPNDDCHIRWNLSWGVEEMVFAIKEKRQPQTSAEFALQVIDVIEKIKLSSRERRYVKI